MHGQEIESLSIAEQYYGVSFPTVREDVTDYLAGMMVSDGAPMPDGLQKRAVSGGQFAVFECPIEAIGESYRYIFTEWLPDAPVSFDPSVPVFEEYPGRSFPQQIRIYVPVRHKNMENGELG